MNREIKFIGEFSTTQKPNETMGSSPILSKKRTNLAPPPNYSNPNRNSNNTNI